ncbi:FliM/FliN family flagellar motor switch protein [uncultured Gimesia sp.]|jgi:flagellar motor switch protein FliN|uniref:FliM/FliN family flagellar motor switch protein n=1 Tax=uncultured Gimesia sp. TaxID=1678688 RepID=UPI002618AAB1|nr:FliM/FliN family flagellar motor switch protein [uncultured Gimesia sp.]
MSGFSQENVEEIFALAGESMPALSDSFNQCFDFNYRLEMGESGVWSPEELEDAFRGPGLVALFRMGEEAMVGLIPASIPLPDWYQSPGDSQSSRLQTLSLEWSMNLIPMDLGDVDEFKTYYVDNLLTEVSQCAPADWAALLRIKLFQTEDESDGQSPSAVIPVIWPLTKLPVTDSAEAETDPAPQPAASSASSSNSAPTMGQTTNSNSIYNPLNRISKLPVQAIVKLATKKIELKQLLSICPGSLITFDKPCEDPLELYINNQVYCQGEAVKIGENFGLKIDRVGFKKEFETKIIEF